MKALRVSIFKDSKIGTCSNNGISERFNEILLLCEDGFVDVNGDEENLCKVDSITFGGRTHYFVRPVAEPTGIGWMSGGSLVYSCDSRFRDLSEYPLCLHDRQESAEQYGALSH